MRPARLEYKWVALTNTTLGMLMATIAAFLVAAVASLPRGGKYQHVEATSPAGAPTGLEPDVA